MAQEVATARHLVLGDCSPDSPCEDCYIPAQLSGVASRERPAQTTGTPKVRFLEFIRSGRLAANLTFFFKVENISVAKDPASSRVTDVEKGEARASNGSSHFQFHNIDLQRASSKGSVLSSAGKVSLRRGKVSR